MRLLNTKTGQFVEKDPEATRYAILSHTWDERGEQTYEELKRIQRRYTPVSQTSQDSAPVAPEGVTSYCRKRKRDETAHAAIPSSTTSSHPQIALGRLTQSEVAALFLMFGEMYGLSSPTPVSASIWDDPELSPKIRHACDIAQKNGYEYIWIDSCCIDKSSSSELSEAINSMYKWYGLATMCYAYLADVPPGADHHAERSRFRKSRWFQRGWTLQELIAPLYIEFLSEDWAPIGSKHALVELVESITKIDQVGLLHLEPLDAFSVAQRLSWAAKRDTTREEDRAYSLLGIFDINMPTLYGEGERAFRRLQEQIMQRIPDQSLFAWSINPRVLLSPLPNLIDTHSKSTLHVKATKYSSWKNLFAPSPDLFQHCEGTTIPHRENAQLIPSHLHQEIDYTLTPYGIRTQFPMLPLTQDLLLHAIPQAKDTQLTFESPVDGQWYLAILECEDATRPGHLLGHVCCIPPSKSSIDFVHCGFIYVNSAETYGLPERVDIFPLSPKTIEYYRSETTLKKVYIPHTESTNLISGLRRQPHTTMKLVLQGKTRDALRSRGYSADLRAPDPTNPTTHSLALANDERAITVEFRHMLENDGRWFAIEAEVWMSLGSCAQDDSARGSDQADRHTVSWEDYAPWEAKLDDERVRLSALGAGTLTVDLGLDFAGHGNYVLRVDVLSDAPSASSAFESAVDLGREAKERAEEKSHSGESEIEDAAREEAGACEMESMESGDVVATSCDTGGGDGHGVLA